MQQQQQQRQLASVTVKARLGGEVRRVVLPPEVAHDHVQFASVVLGLFPAVAADPASVAIQYLDDEGVRTIVLAHPCCLLALRCLTSPNLQDNVTVSSQLELDAALQLLSATQPLLRVVLQRASVSC
eukprot:TRINITY_DN2962_c0_g1_i4.p3 TRINITY_DN2962_c0_g1~~TRINITY_DN2962_c0_g1_i4.p3  ORF type:complete len:136 (+),score=28.22 TRINITY_DN2962_c0_g1_i4:29-409(+)